MSKNQDKKDIEFGHFLSLVLRHNPSAAKINLDSHGWANVEELLKGANQVGKSIDKKMLERIVQENDKNRYSFNEDHTKIRANQGHSIAVDIELEEKTPPDILYHGTATRFLGSIRKEGITRQSRQYVHLSSDYSTAIKVGSRHGIPVVLFIDAAQMFLDGYHFFLSENNVWLCKKIPSKYIQEDNKR